MPAPLVVSDMDGTLATVDTWRGVHAWIRACYPSRDADRFVRVRMPAIVKARVFGLDKEGFRARWQEDQARLLEGMDAARLDELAASVVEEHLWPSRRQVRGGRGPRGDRRGACRGPGGAARPRDGRLAADRRRLRPAARGGPRARDAARGSRRRGHGPDGRADPERRPEGGRGPGTRRRARRSSRRSATRPRTSPLLELAAAAGGRGAGQRAPSRGGPSRLGGPRGVTRRSTASRTLALWASCTTIGHAAEASCHERRRVLRTATEPPPPWSVPCRAPIAYGSAPPPFRGWCGERRGPNADPVRTVHRARQLRLRVRRGHRRPALARDRARRAHRARQPRAPRRERLREEHRRRRGHPRHAPLPVPGRRSPRRTASRSRATATASAMVFLPRDAASREACRDEGRGHPRGGGPHAPRLAPRPHRPRRASATPRGPASRSSSRRSSPGPTASAPARTRTSTSSAACTSPGG